MTANTTIATVLDRIEIDDAGRRIAMPPWDIRTDEPRDAEKRLGRALYEHLHLRRAEPVETRARMVRDRPFEAALAAVVPQSDVRQPVEVIRHDADAEQTLVRLSGARVWLDAHRVHVETERDGGATASVPSTHACMSPGFLLAHGALPLQVASPDQLMRVYLNPRSDSAAPELWRQVLALLHHAAVPYRAKAASVHWFYPRTDAITVYLRADDRDVAVDIADRIRGSDLLRPQTSLLCERLVPGVGIAAEPCDPSPGRLGLSFGEHRSSVIAHAVVDAHRRRLPWRAVLPDALAAAAIDPSRPWRNTSPSDVVPTSRRQVRRPFQTRPAAVASGPTLQRTREEVQA